MPLCSMGLYRLVTNLPLIVNEADPDALPRDLHMDHWSRAATVDHTLIVAIWCSSNRSRA